MIITQKIKLDFARRGITPRVYAVQGDSYTREVEISLYENDAAWAVPDGASVMVRYRKPDGTGGVYDTLPDGTQAWSASGHSLTVTLAPQMLTVEGFVQAQIQISQGTNVLATTGFDVLVERDLSLGVVELEPGDYINWSAWAQNELDQMLAQARDSGEFDGPQGRGVASINGNADGSWVFTYTDGTTETVSSEAYAALTAQLAQLSLEIAGKEQLAPEFADSIDECADTGKLYVLPDGNIYAYTKIETGKDSEVQLNWAYNVGLNSSTGAEESKTTCSTSQSIAVDSTATYTINCTNSRYLGVQVYCYDADDRYLGRVEAVTNTQESGDAIPATVAIEFLENTATFRIRAWHSDATDQAGAIEYCTRIILERTYDNSEIVYAWANTGHAFVPADYENRILALESAVKGDIPIYGIVDGENNIVMSGSLVAGTYTLKYQNSDGSTSEIGTFTIV